MPGNLALRRNEPMPSPASPILLYDGVCGLCNRLVRFILRHDRADIFRFASLQSPFAAAILKRHRIPADMNTVYVVLSYQEPIEQLLPRSDAVTSVLKHLGRRWAFAANVWNLLPRRIRHGAYDLVARHRYRIFGKYDTCPLPEPTDRDKFLDE